VAALVVGAIFVGWFFSFRTTLRLPGMLVRLPDSTAAFLGWTGSLSLFVMYLWWLLTGRLHRDQAQHFMFAGFSFAVAYMNSLSWPTNPIVILPAFGFVVATILSATREAPTGKISQPVIVVACLACILQVTLQKCASPYEWGGWREPSTHAATMGVSFPELKGYRVSAETANFLTRVTEDIDSHSGEQEPIFVYPDLPIFYLLAHRQPETFGYVHYIDVAPDFVDVADANTLRSHPPAVIVYLKNSEEDLRTGEMNFRGGRRSGQRDLVAAINTLSPNYKLLDSFVAPGTNRTVEVLVRR
jgi:hypothetical protein